MTGREAYEEDCRRRPTYPDGTTRRAWEQLCDLARRSWDRDPRPRDYPLAATLTAPSASPEAPG